MFNATTPEQKSSLYDLLLDPTTSSTIHLIFTYLFTFLCISFFHRNFHRFVLARQAFGLQLIHSVSARTVLVTNLPSHMRGDRILAEYFESCNWPVESVSVCRAVQVLDRVLERRTNALLKLEQAWVEWVGNPAKKDQGYDPHLYSGKSTPQVLQETASVPEEQLVDLENDTVSLLSTTPQTYGTASSIHSSTQDNEAHPHSHVRIHSTRPRPTLRPRWFGTKIDAIEHWEKKYEEADEEVKELRKKGRFGATHAAFVTFEDARDAVNILHPIHSADRPMIVANRVPGGSLSSTFSSYNYTGSRTS